MNSPRKSGNRKTGKPSLSEQAHQQILDYLNVAAENSENPAIRDAAIELAKETGKHHRKQDARLSPTLTLMTAVAILILAGVSSWYFFVHYSERIAMTISIFVVGLALVAACLVALFSGNLSQANFVHVVSIVWSKITSIFTASRAGTAADSSTGKDSAPPPTR
jgi:hypothetical protein